MKTNEINIRKEIKKIIISKIKNKKQFNVWNLKKEVMEDFFQNIEKKEKIQKYIKNFELNKEYLKFNELKENKIIDETMYKINQFFFDDWVFLRIVLTILKKENFNKNNFIYYQRELLKNGNILYTS